MARSPLEALVRSAVSATGASDGWVSLVAADHLEVCAYAGAGEPRRWLAARFPTTDAGAAGMAASTGQPLAVRPQPGDALVTRGPMTLLGREPVCYVTVPCGDDDGVIGVLEVVDKKGSTSFDFDDVELLSLLSDVTAAILRERVATEALAGGDVAVFAAQPPTVRAALVGLIHAVERPG